LACTTRALDFGALESIRKTYGNERDLEDLPSSSLTEPAIVFRPHAEKRQLVPYDSKRVLEVMSSRDPLSPIFSSPSDMIDLPEGTVSRSKLVLKHESADHLMKHTRNDEG